MLQINVPMNILVVSAVLPFPLYSGGQVRLYNLLKRLSEHHNITLISYIRTEEETKFCKELSFCHRIETILRGTAWQPGYITKSLFTNKSLLHATYHHTMAQKRIAQIISEESINVVHIEPGYVFTGLPQLDLPLIVSEHNIEHRIYEGYIQRFKLPLMKSFLRNDVHKIKKWEQTIWENADQIITVSLSDKAYINSKGFNNVTVVSNGVDDIWFEFLPNNVIPKDFHAVFIGNFRWIQNQDAVKSLLRLYWPVISKNYPKASLELVGQHFPQAFKKYLSSSVTLTENVDDIRDVLRKAHMSFAPIAIGGGTKYKILEAMAAGVPVISTTKGIEGLDVKHNHSILIGDTTNEWIGNIQTLCNDSVNVKKITRNARQIVEKKYSWSHIADIQEAIWKKYESKKS